jgi:predicted amidohydrolase
VRLFTADRSRKTLKVTLGQFEPVVGDKQENLKKIQKIIEQASLKGSELVLFPELCLSGYVIQDINADIAERIDGKSVQYMQSLCKKHGIYTVFSWPELGEDGHI